MTARGLVRWLLVGRRKGLRARARRAFGVLQWLDREPTAAPAPAPATTAPGPHRTAPAPAPAAASAGPSAGTTAPAPSAAEGWVRVLDARDLAPGELTEVLVGDRPVVIANVGGDWFAVDGTCPHAGGPLGDGALEGEVLTCPWHGWSWDVKTGRSLVDPSQAVETLAVKTSDGGVWVRPV